MKKYLIAAAITAALTASASAADFVCGAPRVALGDDFRDNNPVVNVEVRHNPDDHSWRIFHILRNGLIVSRSEQYSILDASGSGRTQWRGSLNRQRNLYMIGEIKVDDAGEFGYMEWLYDRNKNNRLVMQSVADCAKATPISTPTTTEPEMMTFRVPADISAGHLNIRSGPGANHGLLGAIPAGQTVIASRCVKRDDGIAGADWCMVSWNGITGWASQVGLMPVQGSPLPQPTGDSLRRPTGNGDV